MTADDRVGEPSGFGRFGIVDRGPDWVLCHECGGTFRTLGQHVRVHGLSSAEFRARHGLPRQQPLMCEDLLARRRELGAAIVGSPQWQRFASGRDAANRSVSAEDRASRAVSTPGGRAVNSAQGRVAPHDGRRPDDARWLAVLAEVVAFRAEFGRWPVRSREPVERRLGVWCGNQRRQRLSDVRVAALTAAGFDFEPGRSRRKRLEDSHDDGEG